MIDLDRIQKDAEARFPADCRIVLELVEKIRELKGYKVAVLAEMLRTRELLEESEKLIKAQDRILAAYRLGGNPGNAPQVAMKARAKLAKLRSVSPQGEKAEGEK